MTEFLCHGLRNALLAIGGTALLSTTACGRHPKESYEVQEGGIPVDSSDARPTPDALSTPTEAQSDEEPRSDGTADLFVAGQRDGRFYVLQVDLASGTLSPFGPALPNVSVDRDIAELWVDPAAHRVIVEVRSKKGDASLLAGDGNAWWTLSTDPTLFGNPKVSDDLSLTFTLDAPGDGSPPTHSAVVAFDGTLLLEFALAVDFASAPKVVAFAPDSSWFAMRRDSDLVVRTRAGAETVVRTGRGPGDFYDAGVLVARETSMIIQEQYPMLAWIDLAGQTLSVSGFVPDWTHSIDNYHVNPGALLSYGDRRLDDVIPLAPALEVTGVFAAKKGAGAVIRTSDRRLVALDDTGAVVDAYVPAPSSKMVGGFTGDAEAEVASATIEVGSRLVALHVNHYLIDGDVSMTLERSLDVWAATGTGPGRVVRLRSRDLNAPLLETQIDTRGQTLAWVEDGVLRAVEAVTLVERAVPSSYILSPAHVNVRR